jgi:sulfite reductase beta subunit-like hemoprotein
MDSVRNLTGSPIAGIDPHELFDVRWGRGRTEGLGFTGAVG